MKFISLETTVKKQIKASMKRIADKFLKLNRDKSDPSEFNIAFNIWSNRYIYIQKGVKYYNMLQIDEDLYIELKTTMEHIFSKSIDNLSKTSPVEEVKYPKYFIEKPATKKQIQYANYLMNMIKNESLPDKKYTMYEMNVLISSLKTKMSGI